MTEHLARRLPIAGRRVVDHRERHHTLDWVSYPPGMRVAQRVECGSHAAAPAMLTTYDSVRGTPLTRMVTRIRCVPVTLLKTVGNELR
ncbi:MAG: hypothetical protein D6716_18580 [Chloroflexi bacterium]|nr:MAG: hypothetical protein D6716_18580 [Chloroflexota bacterium]